MTNNDLRVTDKTRLIRAPERASYDRKLAYEIIDSTPMCHVSYVIDGDPYITPTFQWRQGDDIYWHGSSASRFLRNAAGANVALNVMLFDGLVLARSAYHSSANFRSVTVFGRAVQLEGDEKLAALQQFVDVLTPGRWETLRPMNDQEIKATTVLSMPIDEASVKLRTGGPIDDDEDYELPIWAGVIPVAQTAGEFAPDERNLPGVDVPDHVRRFNLG
ncbi:MAG: pyridoxamine 5'-phosphate oxidase family protein [SAR202 cluster bacterium]|nr:pyridoxamine 5'-phosphate oxidase family protein [SAR202 cluster bacterium]